MTVTNTRTLSAPLQNYEAEGYAFPLRVIDQAKAAGYRQRLEASQAALGGRFSGVYTQKPHLLFTWLAELASEPAVLDLAEQIVGPDILLWSTEFFIKQPGDGRYVPWHVDDTYWHIEPEVQTTVWIALSDVGPDNGPLRYIRGSHLEARKPIVSAPSADNMLISGQMAQDIDESRAVDVLLRAGEAAIHDSRALHASDRNTGIDARIGIAARFISTSVRSTAKRESALLVRGTDQYRHFDPEPFPVADLNDAARTAHALAVELRNRNMYGDKHKDQPAMKG